MKNSILLFAQITPKPEYYDKARAALLGILEQTHNELGCYRFELSEGEHENSLYIYEEWANQAALDAHYEQPYITSVFESYEQWLASPVEITRLLKVA